METIIIIVLLLLTERTNIGPTIFFVFFFDFHLWQRQPVWDNARRSLSNLVSSMRLLLRTDLFICWYDVNSNAVCIGRREKSICKNMLIELSTRNRCCCVSCIYAAVFVATACSRPWKIVGWRFVLFYLLFITFISHFTIRKNVK